MERRENPSDSSEGAIRAGEPPFRNEVHLDEFGHPVSSPSDAIHREAEARRRRIALFFFWISLFVFIATIIRAVLRFRELSTWGAGGEAGFAVMGHYLMLWVLTLSGLAISLVLCAIAIPNFKGAIILLIVELVPFALICLGITSVSKPGP
jgi:hypothetical protein